MAEVVAEGEVILRAKENVRAELAKAEAAFDRTMAKLDGQQAEIDIKANMLDFDRKAKEAQAKIDKLDGQKANVKIGADTSKLDTALAKEQANLQKLKLANTRLENQRRDLLEKRQAAEAKYYSESEKAEKRHADTIAKAATDAANARIKAEGKVTASEAAARRARTKGAFDEAAAKQKVDTATARAAERAQKQITTAQNREIANRLRDAGREASAREKIAGSEARLERQYIDLRKKRERFERAQNKTFLPTNERQLIEFDIRGVDEQIAEVRAKLALIGKPPPEVDLHLNVDDRGADSLNRWISAISSTTVRLGPFTTTIAGAGRALALLGPIIIGVVGSLGALVGAVGSAALGFGGALTAGIAGFGLVLGSTGLLLKPLMRDFKNLNTLQDAYHKQVLKTGAGSEKAKDKLKEFDHALGEVSPTTRAAFLGIDNLGKSFDKVAAKARPAFLNTFAEGLRSAQTGLSRFGPEMVQSFNLVAKGVRTAFRALRSPEATGIIGTLFDNAQAALPAFGRGLGNLAASAGRVAAAFSRMLAPLGAGFEKWTNRFTDFTKDSTKLNKFVDGTVKSMRSLGHLLQSTGGFLATFFGAGVGAGVSLMDRMASGIDKITNSIRANPKGLGDFFGDSVDTAERLYGVIAPLASLFVEWATILRPFSNLILSVTGAIASLVTAFAGFGPTRALLQLAFGVFLGGTLITKIRGVTQAIATLAASLGVLGVKQAALRSGSALTGGMLANLGRNAAVGARGVGAAEAGLAAAATRGAAARPSYKGATGGSLVIPAGAAANAEKTAASTAKFAASASRGAKAANVLKVGLTGVGSVLGIANPLFGAAALAAVGAGAAYVYFKHKNDDLKKAVVESAQATYRTADAYRANSGALADTASQAERANLVVRQARRDLDHAKKGTDDYKLAQLNLKDALRARGQQEQAVATNQKESVRLGKEQVDRSQKELSAFENLNSKKIKLDQDYIKREKSLYGELSINGKAREKELSGLLAKRNALQDKATAALNRNAAVTLNNARGLAGLTAATGKAEQQLGAFARTADHASAKKIAIKFQDSGDAGKVAAAAGKAIKAGVPTKIATRVAVSTSDADVAVRRINATKLTPKKLSIVMQGGKEAISTVQHLTGLKLTEKQQRIITQGGPKAIAELSHILGFKLPSKTQNITEQGAARVLSGLASINGVKLSNKQMSALLNDLASGKLSSILGLIQSIPASRTSTITTVYRSVGTAPNSSGKRYPGATGGVFSFATGGPTRNAGKDRRLAGGSYTSPVLQRTIDKALEVATTANAAVRSKGSKVSRPQLIVGEQRGHPEYVIATNPAFRDRNVSLLKAAASRFGLGLVEAAVKGKGPKKTAVAQARDVAKKRLPKKTTYASKDIDQLPKVEAAKQAESDQVRNISIAESKLKEPESFLQVVGQDPVTGDDIFGIDQGAVSSWSGQLSNISSMYADLILKIKAVGKAIKDALTSVGRVMQHATDNITTLDKLEAREQGIIDRKGTSKTEKKAAKARLKVYEDAEKVERVAFKNAKTDKDALDEDYHDVDFRVQEAEVQRDEYQSDSQAVAGKASADLASQTPKSSPSPAVNVNDLNIAKAEAAVSAAALTSDPADDIAAQNQLIEANKAKVAEGEAMLRDNDPTNDIDAYNMITAGNNAISGAQSNLNSGGNGLSGILAYDQARSSLFSTMANNYAASNAVAGMQRDGASAAQMMPVTGGMTANAPITINQSFPAQPDPLTWAAATRYEINSNF